MSGNIEEQIKSDIQNNKVLIYMKGTPEAPQCGFSAATVELIKSLGVPFETRDVIANPDLRSIVPTVSNWPTFPQIFVGGKLIGGCDIVHEMHERGELESLVK
jgi:monothiol glutaredoxin